MQGLILEKSVLDGANFDFSSILDFAMVISFAALFLMESSYMKT